MSTVSADSSDIAAHLKGRVLTALKQKRSPWPAFFGYLVESSFIPHIVAMHPNPNRTEVAAWLALVPNFRALKIEPRLDRIERFMVQETERAASVISCDFGDWIREVMGK